MQRARPYHHGDLKQALLKSAVRLIGESGPQGFTLREVARRAGVSHNAPYRHFRDKEELLAAVAAEGFERLTRAVRRRVAPARSGLDALRLSGLAYVQFALRWPEHLAVMFDGALPPEQYPESQAAGRLAFQTLVEIIERCQKEDALPAGDPLPLALVAWSLVHGIAKLAIAHRLPFRRRSQVLELAEFASDALRRGLAGG